MSKILQKAALIDLAADLSVAYTIDDFHPLIAKALKDYDARLARLTKQDDGFAFPGGEAPPYDGSDDDDGSGYLCDDCGDTLTCPTCGVDKVASHKDVLFKAINPQIAELTERLDRIEKMATPGGPALRGMPRKAPEYTEADLYRFQAATVSDAELRAGYLEKAANAEKSQREPR
jgi:hypothetical protein